MDKTSNVCTVCGSNKFSVGNVPPEVIPFLQNVYKVPPSKLLRSQICSRCVFHAIKMEQLDKNQKRVINRHAKAVNSKICMFCSVRLMENNAHKTSSSPEKVVTLRNRVNARNLPNNVCPSCLYIFECYPSYNDLFEMMSGTKSRNTSSLNGICIPGEALADPKYFSPCHVMLTRVNLDAGIGHEMRSSPRTHKPNTSRANRKLPSRRRNLKPKISFKIIRSSSVFSDVDATPTTEPDCGSCSVKLTRVLPDDEQMLELKTECVSDDGVEQPKSSAVSDTAESTDNRLNGDPVDSDGVDELIQTIDQIIEESSNSVVTPKKRFTAASTDLKSQLAVKKRKLSSSMDECESTAVATEANETPSQAIIGPSTEDKILAQDAKKPADTLQLTSPKANDGYDDNDSILDMCLEIASSEEFHDTTADGEAMPADSHNECTRALSVDVLFPDKFEERHTKEKNRKTDEPTAGAITPLTTDEVVVSEPPRAEHTVAEKSSSVEPTSCATGVKSPAVVTPPLILLTK